LKILFVLPYIPSLVRVRPFHFVRELAQRHEVTVLATSARSEAAHAETLRAFCRHVEVVPLRAPASAWSCAVGALRGEPLQAAACRMPELERRLNDLLGRHRFDLVHVEHFRAAYVAPLIPWNVPTVFDSVDCISLLVERTMGSSHSVRQRLLSRLELARTRRYEARILQQFDRVTVTSPDDAMALRELSPGAEVRLVPNGVDLDYFQPTPATPEPATIVFSGKMSYHANATAALHFAREIFPLIRAERPDARLRIIGSGPPAGIRALARDPAIEVTGYVPNMRDALGSATIAICPVTVKVGIQNKVLEAMAMQIPVVCSRAAAEGLLATPQRDLLVSDGARDFAQQVIRLLGDPARRGELGRAGRAYVEAHHRWDAAAAQLEAVYSEAIIARGGRGLGTTSTSSSIP
jgi:polysaccharide biosynthesis protein PslH